MSKLADRLKGTRHAAAVAVTVTQYLTFFVAQEEYGVDILSVQEIRGWEPVTSIPNTPDYFRGVINLRGVVIPIVDLRLRFTMPAMDYGKTTVVIILRCQTSEGEQQLGIVVDAVSEVYDIDEKDLHAPPRVARDERSRYLKSIATLEHKMISIIDISSLFEVADLQRADLQHVNEPVPVTDL